MKLLYTLELVDVADYYQYYLNTSPVAAAKRKQNIALISVVYLIFIVVMAFVLHNFKMAAFCLAAYFISMLWYLKYGRKLNLKSLNKMYSTGNLRETLGSYSLEITKNGLAIEAPNQKLVLSYADIQGITESVRSIFLIVGPSAAYIIPKKKVSEASLVKFVKSLEKLTNKPNGDI